MNGIAPDVLSTDSLEYYFAQFFLAPPTGTIYENPYLSVIRGAGSGQGSSRRSRCRTTARSPAELASRRGRRRLRRPVRGEGPAPQEGRALPGVEEATLVLGYRREDFVRETQVAGGRAEVREAAPLPGRRSRRRGVGRRSRSPGDGEEAQRAPARQRAARELPETLRGGRTGRGGPPRCEHLPPAWSICRPPLLPWPRCASTVSLRPKARLSRPPGSPGSWPSSAATACSPATRRCRSSPSSPATTLPGARRQQGKAVDGFRDEEPGRSCTSCASAS